MSALLRVEALEVGYGRVQVLFGVDLEVAEGEVLAVLGANAAGKSTLLRAVTGLTPPWRGRVLLDGEDVTGSAPGAMARRGVVQMPGGRGIFPDLSVGDNLRMATWLERRSEARVAESMDRAVELFPVLGERLSERAGLLSGGQQQMLSLALAFMGRPRLLLVDELSLGLAPALVEELLGVVARLRDEGVTVVLVEQSPDRALGVADRALFLEKGEVRYDGSAAGLAQRDDLLRPVFLTAVSPSPNGSGGAAAAGAPPILSASGVDKRFGGVTALAGVDLAIAPGEIVGLLGPNGAGKTTLLDVLSGFVVPDSGSVTFWGDDVTGLPPEVRAHRGLGRSFQDALLFPGLTTAENLALSCERWVTSREPLAAGLRLPASLASEAVVSERVERLLALLGLAWLRDKFPDQLSTGARRLVEFGSLLAQEPDVLLLDEPSAGIARAEAAALAPLLRRIRDASGAAMVIVEHDMALLRASCDRLVALEEGRVVAEGRPAEVLAAL